MAGGVAPAIARLGAKLKSLVAAGRVAGLSPPASALRGPGRMPGVLAWAIGVACLLALAYRFRFGSELTDETFSIAMPYRVVLGDKPFVDEVSIQQTAGMLLLPFVWLYVKITGGTSGIVLFVRGVHLFYKALAALCVYAAARRLLAHRSSAIAVAFVPFAFVPHSLPNVGYNALGMTLTTAGAFLCAAAVVAPSGGPRRGLLVLAGAAHAFAAFAYPPMIVGPLLAAVLVFACAPTRRFAAFFSFAAGCALALALVSPAFAFGGVAGIKRALAFGHDAAPGEARVKAILHGFWDGVPSMYAWAFLGLVGARLSRSSAAVAVGVTATTIGLVFWNRDESHLIYASLHTVMYVGAFAPLLLVVARVDADLLRAVTVVVLPSFACAVAAGTFSTQGVSASSLGLHASMVLFVVLAARSLERAAAERTHCLFPSAAVMFVLVLQCCDYVYRDAPMAQLTTLVTSGPFRGIWTTPDRAAMFKELATIAKTYDTEGGRVLCLYDMPGLYLFSKMPPSANTVWEVSWYGQDQMVAYWQRHRTGKGITVIAKNTGRGPIADPIVAAPERMVLETPHFTVYSER